MNTLVTTAKAFDKILNSFQNEFRKLLKETIG